MPVFSTLAKKFIPSVSNQGLGYRAVKGSAWLLTGRAMVQVGGLARIGIVARFVPPTEFGVLAIVLLMLQALDAFSTPGLNQALIQRPGKIEPLFPSVFAVNVARGMVLGAAIIAAGPYVAAFFNTRESAPVIQAASALVLVRSFQSPAIAKVHRDLNYKSFFHWDITTALAGFSVAMVMLTITNSVWVLLVAMIAEESVRSITSYIFAPWRPRFRLSWSDVTELSHFGRWVVAGTAVGFLTLQLDSIAVGKLLDARSLGLYQMAMKISQLPATQISQVVATVAFPALAKLAGDHSRFRTLYLRMFLLLSVVNLSLSGAMVILAEPMVTHLLGDKWLDIVLPLRILAIAGFIRSMVTVGGRVFYSVNKPRYDFVLNCVRLAMFSVLIIPAVLQYGIMGASMVVLVSISSVVPVYLTLIRRSTGIHPVEHIEYVIQSIASALAQGRRMLRGA